MTFGQIERLHHPERDPLRPTIGLEDRPHPARQLAHPRAHPLGPQPEPGFADDPLDIGAQDQIGQRRQAQRLGGIGIKRGGKTMGKTNAVAFDLQGLVVFVGQRPQIGERQGKAPFLGRQQGQIGRFAGAKPVKKPAAGRRGGEGDLLGGMGKGQVHRQICLRTQSDQFGMGLCARETRDRNRMSSQSYLR